ncbi:MAG: hypothetical protein ACQESH_01535 [Campylobacterota bacterium]
MRSKQLYALGALLLLAVMALYFYLNPSYRLSLEAKAYYTIGDYQNAYTVASQAYERNNYNNMAFTIQVQSQNALKHIEFIELAKQYYAQIQQISNKKEISRADKLKIKMLAEVVLQSYERLKSKMLHDKVLVEDAKKYRDNFQKLYDSLFRDEDRGDRS